MLVQHAPEGYHAWSLELNLASELHGARVMPAIDLAKGTAPDVDVNRVGTTVVECIERLQPKLQTDAFAEIKVLYQRHVPELEPWA